MSESVFNPLSRFHNHQHRFFIPSSPSPSPPFIVSVSFSALRLSYLLPPLRFGVHFHLLFHECLLLINLPLQVFPNGDEPC
jgi:hypothetical protein